MRLELSLGKEGNNMAREKDGYRDMLQFLKEEYPDLGLLASKEKTARTLKISKDTVRKYIREGKLSEVNGKIPVMSIARLLCS